MNLNLLLPVTREEIREAAFSLGSTKAPGPDGFSGKFYHSAWPEIGENICSMVQEFFVGNSSLHEINDTNVTLIPKIEKPDHVSHFCPIGLCNSSYKIISKIIASRMRPLLDACISQNQSAFIPGRLIQDNIIIAHEVYHYLRRKKKGNKYEFALKMDMSKAYDRVEWDFLELVLLKFGFCEDWVHLIMKCVNSVRLNLCVSGEKIGSISLGKGLRQGDPLSPYLFILVTEVLSAMITKSQMSKNLQGIKLSNSCPELSHCFFADDALFFMNANERNCTNLANILNQYCVVSGQSANLDKSSIFFSANTPEIIKSRTSGILGIQAMQDPGKYLGIPSVWGKTKHQALSYIRERVRNKIQGWTKSTLSFAGREVMIKSIINAIPIYPMNCFKFTIKACKELNSLIANFWWEGNAAGHKLHWKSWDSLTEAKCAGGMGFRDFTIANDALLAKTAWRLLNNPDDLWVRVLKSIYFPQGEFMDVEKGYKASWCWSSIIDGRDFLKKDLLWDLGDGSSIRIWEDRWVPDVQFPEKPVNNYDDILQQGRVCDLIVHGSWNLSPIRHLISDDLAHAIIQIPIPLNGLKDKIIWTPASNGNYSVKLGYRNAKARRYIIHKPSSSTNMSPANWRSIWKLNIVPRVQHFVWRILNQVVATNDALFRRKRASSKLCPICDREEETVEHLFFHCPWTRCVWFGCHLGVKTDVIQVRNFTSWWLCITDVGSNFASADITLICWILWFIWKQRNEKVFNLREPSPQFVIEWAMRSNLELCALNDVTDMNESISITDPDSVHWCFPPPGILKINCDGAYSSAMGTAAIGIICRNEYGDFVWGFADKIKSLSAFMTEALALKRALMLAVDLGHDKILFETDSQLLKSSVESQQPDLYDWKCRSIIQDIINLLASRVGFSLTFTPRRGNFAADHIAADAFKGVCPMGWVSQPSLSLSSILTLDAQKAGRHFDATASP